ncbi:MAG: plastocyanin/azurin family copper-binding protein [Ilumatobacteraceae bacterium]
MRTFGMSKTLLRTVAIASIACVVTLSACQPQQPQGAESSGLAELNDESVTEGTATSEVVSTTENSAPAAPETTTTTEAPTGASSTAVETTSTVVETTTTPTLQATATEEELGTTSSVAETSSTIASTTSAAPQTTSTIATTTSTEATTTTVAASTTTSSPAVVVTTHSIDISGFSFAPSALTVEVGDTVTWTNFDSAIHTVTFNDSPSLSSGGLQEGDTHSVTFDNVGTYAYGCSPHASMQGTITVTK